MTIPSEIDQLPPGIKACGPTDDWPLIVQLNAPRGTKGVMVWEPPFGAMMAAVPDLMLRSMIESASVALGVDERTEMVRKHMKDGTHLLFFVKEETT